MMLEAVKRNVDAARHEPGFFTGIRPMGPYFEGSFVNCAAMDLRGFTRIPNRASMLRTIGSTLAGCFM